jgi:preprotein translocase subunit YajC
MIFISPALAETTTAAPQQAGIAGFLPLIIIFVIFYFLLIRPQQKRIKEHNLLIAGVKKGDVVYSSGGIIGKVKELEGKDIIHVEVAKGVVIQMLKSTVSNVSKKDFYPIGEAEKKKSKK